MASTAERLAGAQLVVRVQPPSRLAPLKLRELWEYRELLYFLTWRDLKVRYKQTLLGVLWAVLQPLLTALVFSLLLGRLANVPSDGVPRLLFTYAAMVPWTFFANGLTQSSNSLVNNSHLITKVYFPRLAMPIATLLAGVVDFLLSFAVLLVFMLFYHMPLTWHMLWLPLPLLMGLVTGLGVGLWFSALNVQFRDVKYVIPFLAQVWMFATPVLYPSSMLPTAWRGLYALNPMAGVIEIFRWATLGTQLNFDPSWPISALVAVLVLVSGAYYFRHMERYFADVV